MADDHIILVLIVLALGACGAAYRILRSGGDDSQWRS